ncbi:glycosyl transferase, group 2 family protein [alpha proteobacterium BAL199]|jgi:hypothetical protein|nr:glycosyl transferase, group 2 family protein [alpha proteobacterium BAL199]
MRQDAAAVVGPPGSRQLSLSVVIVVDRDVDRLAACLQALATAPRRGIDPEILVVDPDDSPAVREIAEAAGARILPATGSRGALFASGTKAATGEWLLLLRSGTVLERGWDATLVVFAHEERNRERGAVYSYRADSDDPGARCIERTVRFRNRWLGLPSGAQGLVIRRRFLTHLGGVPDLNRGEDLVLARRLGLGRLALFDVTARVRPVFGAWPALAGALRLLLFGLRVPPRWLQRLGD